MRLRVPGLLLSALFLGACTSASMSVGREASVEASTADNVPAPDAPVEDRVSPVNDAAPRPDAEAMPDVIVMDSAPEAEVPDVVQVDNAPEISTDSMTPDVAVVPDVVAADVIVDVAPTDCPLPPACDGPLPPLGARASWRHSIQSTITTATGSARHRGRDLFFREGEPQWALAKFAYGLADDDLQDEDVDIYVQRSCSGMWERLGTARTTNDGTHATVEGVEDTGGRVYFQIPAAQRLGVGWHRLLFVVKGDLTTAEQFINVLPADARVVVSDVDGTLTESENAEFFATLTGGTPPAANPGAAEAFMALARRGYHIMYLTARPEWTVARSRQWFPLRGFPRGILHTTLGGLPLVGASAQTFKTDELRALRTRLGRAPDFAFGNTDTDVGAYVSAMLMPPSNAYYYQFSGDLRGGTLNNDYRTLVPRFQALAPLCR